MRQTFLYFSLFVRFVRDTTCSRLFKYRCAFEFLLIHHFSSPVLSTFAADYKSDIVEIVFGAFEFVTMNFEHVQGVPYSQDGRVIYNIEFT